MFVGEPPQSLLDCILSFLCLKNFFRRGTRVGNTAARRIPVRGFIER